MKYFISTLLFLSGVLISFGTLTNSAFAAPSERVLTPGTSTSLIFPNGTEVKVSCVAPAQVDLPFCRILPVTFKKRDGTSFLSTEDFGVAAVTASGQWLYWMSPITRIFVNSPVDPLATLRDQLRELKKAGQCQ